MCIIPFKTHNAIWGCMTDKFLCVRIDHNNYDITLHYYGHLKIGWGDINRVDLSNTTWQQEDKQFLTQLLLLMYLGTYIREWAWTTADVIVSGGDHETEQNRGRMPITSRIHVE